MTGSSGGAIRDSESARYLHHGQWKINTLQRVLIAIDFSQPAAEGLAVAREHCPGPLMRLVTVIKPSEVAAGASGAFSEVASPLHTKDMRQMAEEKRLERLLAWAIDGEECAVVFGSAPEEIARHAREWGRI